MSEAISTSSRMLSWSQKKREARRCVFSYTMTYPSNDYLSSQIHLVNYTFESGVFTTWIYVLRGQTGHYMVI